jgi:hypothetical protein
VSQPTVEELQAILDSEDPLRIEILPDGSIQAVSIDLPLLVSVAPKVLTFREAGLAENDDYWCLLRACGSVRRACGSWSLPGAMLRGVPTGVWDLALAAQSNADFV